MSATILDDRKSYSAGAMLLHWLMAILIVASFAMAQFFDDVPKDWSTWYLNLHALLGTGILALLLIRLGMRLAYPPPAPSADLSPLEKTGSQAVHWLLYALMFVAPAIGLVALFYRGKGIDFGLFQIASPVERLRDVARSAKGLHELAAKGLIVVATAHFLAAMHHRFVRRDGVLGRMLPSLK